NALANDRPADPSPDGSAVQIDAEHANETASAATSGTAARPRTLALGKAVRLRDKEHRKFISRQACLVCGRVPSDPHHLRFQQPRAIGARARDEFTVPAWRVHHRELPRHGNEAAWWAKLNIDPVPVALKLWQSTRGLGEVAVPGDLQPSGGASQEPVSP